VTSVVEGSNGTLWAGTDRGLNRFDRTANIFRHFGVKEGLPNNFIYGVLEDGKGNLWISTNRGLSKFDPQRGIFRNYDPRDGVQSNEFNLSAYFRSPGGEMFFGGVNGLNVFFPDSVRDNPYIPPVVITSLRISNELANLGTAHCLLRNIALSYDQNFLSFELASMDFSAPQKTQYAYFLEGVDESWNYSGSRRYANYTSLDPGDYVFRFKASNSDGVWNEEGGFVRIAIAPPFWATWWFRLAVVALFVGAAFAAYRYRINRIMEMHRMRLRIAGDLHDEIGSNLSTIVVASDMVGRRGTLQGQDRSQLSEISALAMQTANSMREIVWFINPEHDRLDDLLLRMKDVAIAMLGQTAYSFRSPDGSSDMHLTPDARRNVFLIFKEALNNVVKHAGATQVDIDIRVDGGIFRMSITDNGIGFDGKAIKRGEGLNNLHKRAAGIGAELGVTSAPGKGTSIVLTTRTSHLGGKKT
jgi:hypothetical protein